MYLCGSAEDDFSEEQNYHARITAVRSLPVSAGRLKMPAEQPAR